MNSHVQMPRCVLKRFEDKNHRYFYYDVAKEVIGSNGRSSSTNTIKGYYRKETEDYLNHSIETPFSDVLMFIDTIEFDNPSVYTNQLFRERVLSYFYALLARSQQTLEPSKKNAIYTQFLSEQDQRHIVVTKGIQEAKNRRLFEDYLITLAINKTNLPFVLPTRGAYSILLNELNYIFLPIDPRLALVLAEPKAQDFIVKNNIHAFIEIMGSAVVNNLNKIAFYQQCNDNWGFVVSTGKEILEGLRTINERSQT